MSGIKHIFRSILIDKKINLLCNNEILSLNVIDYSLYSVILAYVKRINTISSYHLSLLHSCKLYSNNKYDIKNFEDNICTPSKLSKLCDELGYSSYIDEVYWKFKISVRFDFEKYNLNALEFIKLAELLDLNSCSNKKLKFEYKNTIYELDNSYIKIDYTQFNNLYMQFVFDKTLKVLHFIKLF